MRATNIFIGIILLLAAASAAQASLAEIRMDRIPGQETAQLLDDVRVLEEVAENWSPEWRYGLPKEEAVSQAKRALAKIDELLATTKGAPAGELLLLKGLTAHYAYNLDLQDKFSVAVDALGEARKALPADCRPLWFLGNHYAKGADAGKGMPLLKQAAQECGERLPRSFWEDYAYAAVLAAMPATGTYALDQVKARNGGVITEKMKAVEEGVTRRLARPVPGKKYKPDDIWQSDPGHGMTRLVNYMYGLMVTLPGDWRISPFGVRDGSSGIAIKLPRKVKGVPVLEAAVFVLPASSEDTPENALRNFLAAAGTKRSYHSAAAPDFPAGDKFLWLESRQKKGSRILAGVLRRPQPAYPGLVLESPHNVAAAAEDEAAPHYYVPVRQFTRLPGDLDYLVMVEGAPAAFENGRADLELLLRNLVME